MTSSGDSSCPLSAHSAVQQLSPSANIVTSSSSGCLGDGVMTSLRKTEFVIVSSMEDDLREPVLMSNISFHGSTNHFFSRSGELLVDELKWVNSIAVHKFG